MKNIYICEPNCRIHKNGEYLTVRKHTGKLSDVSLIDVRTIILLGNIQITMQAVSLLMERGIDILLLSSGGRLKGRVASEHGKNILMRIAQYDIWFQEEKRMEIAKSIVKQKIMNQKKCLNSYRYRRKISELKEIEKMLTWYIQKIDEVKSIGELMGIEGSAAARYFECFPLLLKEYDFQKRVRRPAYDPINALLNLTYTFLKNEISTILSSYSFDVQLGFLHNIRSGRDSLALDFMEPYRPIFADRFVISLLSRKIIKKEEFELDEDGMKLNAEAMKRYCVLFQENLYETAYEGKIWKRRMEEDVLMFRKELMMLCEHT